MLPRPAGRRRIGAGARPSARACPLVCGVDQPSTSPATSGQRSAVRSNERGQQTPLVRAVSSQPEPGMMSFMPSCDGATCQRRGPAPAGSDRRAHGLRAARAYLDLAAEPRRVRQAERQVEHVLLLLLGLRQHVKVLLLEDNVARGAGH